MEHGCAPPSTRRGLTGWNGTQALAGLAVSKCALAARGCAPCRTVSPDVLLQQFHYRAAGSRPCDREAPGSCAEGRTAGRTAGETTGRGLIALTLRTRSDRSPDSSAACWSQAICRTAGDGSEGGDLRGKGVRRRADDDLNDAAGTHHAEGPGGPQRLLVDLCLVGDLHAQTRDAGLKVGDVLLAAETGDDV